MQYKELRKILFYQEFLSHYFHLLLRPDLSEKKEATESHGIGLANLNKRYQLIANKEIEIKTDNSTFIVKLPILKI